MTTALETFHQGGILAYPTEAVFGLGCDPDNKLAVDGLLSLKKRPIEKGLILLAANYSQLLPYIDDSLIPEEKRLVMLSQWPNGITYLVPKNNNTPTWLTGKFSTLAVRVTDQADVVALCNQVNKPLVSTSANLSGEKPAETWQQVKQNQALASKIDFVIEGKTLGFNQPSTIIDALTGEVFRS